MLSAKSRPSQVQELIREADRQMTICNACRYCEGYCAVFPAMERRRTFDSADLLYMANLCFECRACYYACPYTPPHEYAINVPQVMSSLRLETYREYSGPRVLSRFLFGRWGPTLAVLLVCVGLIFGLALAVQGPDVLFSSIVGEGAFYEVVPYAAMSLPALALSAYWLLAFAYGAWRFWRDTGGRPWQLVDAKAFVRASKDAFGLEYLRGGGDGCTYPDQRPSQARRWAHHLVLYGVLLDLASTTLAAIMHNFLGRDAPYPYLSGPVILGTVGGVMIVAGVVGFFWLKYRADRVPAQGEMLELDMAFLTLLLLTSLSGLALLALRETAAMGALLVIHLGIVAALYVTLPFSKFAHVVYRYAALIRYRIEQEQEAPRPTH
jgi:citrate/tricarballylate utilization protein